MNRKTLKLVLITVISFALIALPFHVRNILAADKTYKFSNSSTVYFKQVVYQEEVNKFFNKKIKLLFDEKGSREIVKDKKKCRDNNVTTFCVASEAFDMFNQYEKELLAEKKNVEEELDKAYKAAKDNEPYVWQGPIVGYNQEKRKGIDEDLQKAEKALDLTIKAYNELQIAYPMHLQYQDMINNLEKYRLHLESIESMTEPFPKVFVNATTTKCT